MKSGNKVIAILASTILASSLALAGCSGGATSSSAKASSSTKDQKVIKVGATPTPHAEILNEAVKQLVEEKGYYLDVVEFNDYVMPNTALDAGEIDANYFQHEPYLDDFNKEHGTNLKNVADVHFEPFGIYAGKTSSIEELKSKLANGEQVKISVPNDTTNEARALLLLQDNGLIELPENAGLDVTAIDIVNKPANLTINELEAAQVARSLNDVDIACINGNYAQDAGLDVNTDALAVESAESLAASTYANILAVKAGNENSPAITVLAEALTSPKVKEYIKQHYGNSVIAVF